MSIARLDLVSLVCALVDILQVVYTVGSMRNAGNPMEGKIKIQINTYENK